VILSALASVAVAVALVAPSTAPADRNDAINRPSRASHARVALDASQPPARWEKFMECVSQRESNDTPDAVNGSSGAAGLFQFLPAWQHGLPYMVRDRLVRFGMPAGAARGVRLDLSETPIRLWHPLYQRIGFLEVLDRGGDEHWALPHSRCEKYR
jgi:hypothetical protein